MLQALTKLSPAEFESQTGKYPVILFSPRLRQRNAFMAAFLASPDAYLHTLSAMETTLPAFVHSLVTALREFFPDFGSQTVQAATAGPADLAEALVADLKQLKSALKTLILDDFDRLMPDDAAAIFFEQFVSKLPRGMKLVVNARRLPYQPWGELAQAGHALVLGEEHALDGGILTPSASRKPHLEVYGFGTGHVYVDGLPVETWDGPLPRNLFFYFIDHPMITRDEIFETFWPGMGTKEATNVFHVTKRKINERLGYDFTAYASGFYRLSDAIQLHYDVAAFEKEAAISPDSGSEAIQSLGQAIHLYRTEFLHTHDMPWISQRREHLRLTYAGTLISLGRIYKSLGNSELAMSFYLRAVRAVPQREDIHRDLMTLYAECGEHFKITAQYQALKDTLKRTLGITPAAATRELYSKLTGEFEFS